MMMMMIIIIIIGDYLTFNVSVRKVNSMRNEYSTY